MTMICPADSRAFSATDWAGLNTWAALSRAARCRCCGDLLVRLDHRRVEVTGAAGLEFATLLASEIGQYIGRPLSVRVLASHA